MRPAFIKYPIFACAHLVVGTGRQNYLYNLYSHGVSTYLSVLAMASQESDKSCENASFVRGHHVYKSVLHEHTSCYTMGHCAIGNTASNANLLTMPHPLIVLRCHAHP